MSSVVNPVRTVLEPAGLNLWGVASTAVYDRLVDAARRSEALLPGTRSIVVVASGGAALWHAFLADLRRDRRGLTEEPHPLDAFVRRAVLAADPLLGDRPRRWFFAAADADPVLDFRVLGQAAGLGAASRLGLLLHPTYGTWIGLRAALFSTEDLPTDTPGAPDSCAGCPAPCVAACPGNAFPEGRWDVDRCSDYHVASDECRSTCQARLACPVGAELRYPAEEIAYHYHRPSGRRWLRTWLGVADSEDRHEGVGPLWTSWREVIRSSH